MDRLTQTIYRVLLREEFPTNCMGASSSTSGTGPVDTFDPLLGKTKGKIGRRKPPKIDVAIKKKT
jgi:hypothetical protein